MEMIAVVGLGYVGLPLAVAFGKLMPTLGYDLSQAKVANFQNHIDPSGTVTAPELRAAAHLKFSPDTADALGLAITHAYANKAMARLALVDRVIGAGKGKYKAGRSR